MAESDYQRKLKREAEAMGWTVIKLVRATVNGYPDLLLLHPIAGVVFLEVKGKGGKLSKLQEYRLNDLTSKGFTAFAADPSEHDKTINTLRNIMADVSRLIEK